MKQAKSGEHSSAEKSHSIPKNIDEYLAGVPEPARSTLNKVREMIRSAAPPEATEAISYRICVFKYKGRPLLWFAAFRDHCSLFPGSPSVIKALKNELKSFQISKGTIRFPLDKPPSAALVKKLVKARIAENEHKKRR